MREKRGERREEREERREKRGRKKRGEETLSFLPCPTPTLVTRSRFYGTST
jgi:hypothetical protein